MCLRTFSFINNMARTFEDSIQYKEFVPGLLLLGNIIAVMGGGESEF